MIDVRMFTVGPRAGELASSSASKGADRGVIVDPGRRADRLLDAIDALGITTLDAILLTHTHFDHIGAVAPVARRHGRPGLLPRARDTTCSRTSWTSSRGRGSARSRATSADHTVAGGETLELAGLDDRRHLYAGAQPGPCHVRASAARTRCSRATSCSRARSDASTSPAATGRRCSLDRVAARRAIRRRRRCTPGHMGLTTLGRERATNPFLARTDQLNTVIQAPSGTFDVLPEDAARREYSRRSASGSSARPATGGSRRRRSRRPSCSRAGVGEADRHRPEGDVHVRRRRRPLADAAARGHRARMPRLHRARDAQAPAAGEALVPVDLLPRGGAPAGPLPAVLAGRGRGDRLRWTRDRCRADRAARRSARGARRQGRAAAAVEPRHAGDARRPTARS